MSRFWRYETWSIVLLDIGVEQMKFLDGELQVEETPQRPWRNKVEIGSTRKHKWGCMHEKGVTDGDSLINLNLVDGAFTKLRGGLSSLQGRSSLSHGRWGDAAVKYELYTR